MVPKAHAEEDNNKELHHKHASMSCVSGCDRDLFTVLSHVDGRNAESALVRNKFSYCNCFHMFENPRGLAGVDESTRMLAEPLKPNTGPMLGPA